MPSGIKNGLLEIIRSFFINPIIRWEFLGYLRRGRAFALMGSVLVVCSVIVCVLWNLPYHPGYPVGRRLYFSMLAGELAVILLFLPGIIARAFIREWDQNTLSLLLTTPLGPSRILAGKWISALGGMILLVVSTLPMISICVARGGISPFELVTGITLIFYVCLVTSCFAVFHSIRATTAFRVILLTHLTLFVCYGMGGAAFTFAGGIIFGVLSVLEQLVRSTGSPMIFNNPEVFIWGPAVGYSLLATGVPIFLLALANRRFQNMEPCLPIAGDWQPTVSFQLRQEKKKNQKKSRSNIAREFQDGQNPFFQREQMEFHLHRSPYALPSWYILAILSHFIFLAALLQEGRWVALITLAGIAQMSPAFASALFAGEREKGTWDLLITVAARPRRLLFGKLLSAGSQCGLRAMALFFPPFILAYLMIAAIWIVIRHSFYHLLPLPYFFAYIPILSVQMVFMMMISVFFSAASLKVSGALAWSYAVIFFYCVVLLGVAAIPIPAAQGILESLLRVLCPMYLLVSTPSSPASLEIWLQHALGHIGVFTAGSVIFYYLTEWVLQRERTE